MIRRWLLILAFVFSTVFQADCVRKRTIIIENEILFPFDPITDRYLKGSLASAATYIASWREELGTENVEVFLSAPSVAPLDGYRLYDLMEDSTLFRRVNDWFGVWFGVKATGEITDTIPSGSILVIDFDDSSEPVSKVVDISGFEASRQYTEYFRNDIMAVKKFFASPIAVIEDSITTRDSYFGPSAFDALFNEFQQETTGAGISFFAPPRFDAIIPAGNIYIKDIYDLFRYNNTLVTVLAKGSLLLEFLEELYARRYYRLDKTAGDLVRIKTPYYLHDSPAGVEFSVNLTKKRGNRIESLRLPDGNAFSKDSTYTIALNSFQARWFTEKDCPEQDFGDYKTELILWMKEKQSLRVPDLSRWKLMPERWVREAADRELRTIF